MAFEDYFTDFTRRDWEIEHPDGSVRTAIVGVGGFARQRALPGITAGTYCEPTVLVSGSPDRVAGVADEFDVEHVFDYESFLAGDLVEAYDAVYVATPNALHGTYVEAAAEQGKHVLCEKPLDVSVEAARAARDACEDADVTLMTAYRLQTEPTVRRTQEMLRDGVVGDVVQIHGSFSNPLLEHASVDSWRLDADLAGGGALVDLGVYPLNTVRFLLDDDPHSIYACMRSEGYPFDEVDEHVAFQLEFPSGTTASFTASLDAHAHSQLQLVGTGGMLSIASPFGGVVPHDIVIESDEIRMEYTGEPTDEVREEFDYFGYCVLTGTEPEPDGADAIVDIQAIEAAYESADRRRPVDLH